MTESSQSWANVQQTRKELGTIVQDNKNANGGVVLDFCTSL